MLEHHWDFLCLSSALVARQHHEVSEGDSLRLTGSPDASTVSGLRLLKVSDSRVTRFPSGLH